MAPSPRVSLPIRVPLHEVEFLQMVDVQQLAGFRGRKISAVARRRTSARSIRRVLWLAPMETPPAASSRRMACWMTGVETHAQIDHVAAAGQQAGHHAFAHHDAAGARIAPDHHRAAGIQKRAECRRRNPAHGPPSCRRPPRRAGRRAKCAAIWRLRELSCQRASAAECFRHVESWLHGWAARRCTCGRVGGPGCGRS